MVQHIRLRKDCPRFHHCYGYGHHQCADDLLAPWHFRDDKGRLDLVMMAIYNNETTTKVTFADNQVDQVFDRFDGCAVLDSGERVEVRNLVAFCEHAVNNW